MRLALAALLGLVVLAACGENSKPRPKHVADEPKPASRKPFTKQEMRWLIRLRHWEQDYADAASKVDDSYLAVLEGKRPLSALRRAVRPLSNCARSLRRALVRPPSERLEPAFGLLLDACEQDEKSAAAQVRAFTSSRNATSNQGDAYVKSQALFGRARDSIEAMLLANRPLPVAEAMAKNSRIEPRFSRAVNLISVRRVEIRCWSKRDWRPTSKEYRTYAGVKFDVAGFANPTRYRANIAPAICARAARFTYKHWRPVGGEELYDLAFAVGVLAHETEHLSNPSASEAETECHAMQDVREVAHALGASRAYARRLAGGYWKVIYPQEPAGYGTRLCYSGGPLDSDPQSRAWP
jgi:hypothetical protein